MIMTKQQAVEKLDEITRELEWVDIEQMKRDLARLKTQLEDNDPEWEDTWSETIDGCDPWGIFGLERALSLFGRLGSAEVIGEETA